MNLEKQNFIAVWVFLLSGGVIYLIRNFTFFKRKKDNEYNVSESIYLGSVLLSAGIIVKSSVLLISKSFDITYKQFSDQLYFKIIQTSSAISITGVILLSLTIIISKFSSGILFPKRSELLEFENNNLAYGVIRAALLLMFITALSLNFDMIMEYFVPNDIPFFRH